MAENGYDPLNQIDSQANQIDYRNKANVEKIEDIERRCGAEIRPIVQNLKHSLNESKKESGEIIKKVKDAKKDRQVNFAKIEDMEKKIRILEEDEAQNVKRIVHLEKEIFEQDKKINELREDVEKSKIRETKMQDDLEETRNELTEIKSALQTGQIAFTFEKDLALYIYPNDKKIGSKNIFTNMLKWLEQKKDTPQGREADKKWNKLKEEFMWSSDHERIFFKLLQSRKEYAHPAATGLQIPKCFTDAEQKCIKDLNKMIDRVNDLMNE